MNLPHGDNHDRRNVPVQIQKGMEVYRALAFPEVGPREKRQTEIDAGRVQGINRLIQRDAEGIGGVKLSGFYDEDLGEIGINPPIPVLIGVGKGVLGELSMDARMIKSGPGCPQASLNVSQTFPIRKLGEGYAEILIPSGKADHLAIAVVLIYTFSEFVCWGGG